MTHTITIEALSDADFALFKELARRLGLSASETRQNIYPSQDEQQAAIRKFSGSWQGDESADDLEAMIHLSRNDQPRDIEC